MGSNYDWSNKDHIKKKMSYIRNVIILGNKPYDELPDIQKNDFDEYVEEYFRIKKLITNHSEVIEISGEPSIYEKGMILDDPANAASESLDFYLHPMIKEFYERLDIYSKQIESDFDKPLTRTKINNQSKGFAVSLVIIIATIAFGIGLGMLLLFIK